MRKIRFRLRTIMIVIAFVALFLTVVMQSIWLRQAAVREALNRAVAEQLRAEAELGLRQARAALELARKQLQEKAAQ